jgi:hypothetical protein
MSPIPGIVAAQAIRIASPPPPPPPPPRLPAVRIDDLNATANLHWASQTGAPTTSLFTASMWIYVPSPAEYFAQTNLPVRILTSTATVQLGIEFSGPGPDDIGLAFFAGVGGGTLTIKTTGSAYTGKYNSWHHLFMYADLNHAAHAKVYDLMLDGVSVVYPTDTVDASAAFTIVPSTHALDIPDPSFTNLIQFFDVWIAYNQLQTDVTKFRNAITGAPVDLGSHGELPTTVVPTYFFSGDKTAFATNRGVGTQPTLVGVISDAETYPGGPAGMTIDGTAVNQSISAASSGTVSLTTALTNDIIVVAVHTEATTARTVSGIADTSSLTWHHRTSQQLANTPSGYTGNLEVWWALASSTLSSDTITVTLSGSVDAASIVAFAINGARIASPFDAALPLTNTGTTGNPSVSGISTASTEGMFLMFGANSDNFGVTFGMEGNLYTIASAESFGAVNLSAQDAQREVYFSAAAGLTLTFGGSSWGKWIAIVDALVHA